MPMKPREKKLAIVVAAVLGLLAADQLLLTPLLDSTAALAQKRAQLQLQYDQAQKAITSSRQAARRWKAYQAAGLSGDGSGAESALLKTLRESSQAANLPLTSLRPDRASARHGLRELSYQASAEGSLRSVMELLFQLETARSPVRLAELQLTSRTETSDKLTMQIRVSTLWDNAQSAASLPTPALNAARSVEEP